MPVPVWPGRHRLYVAPFDTPRHHDRVTPAPHVSPRCPRRKNCRRCPTRPVGGVERRPPGERSLPPRERGGSVPGRAPPHDPRSPSRALAAILSPGTPRTDVWSGRGTVVVPRGVGWRSGIAAVSGHVITGIFSKIHLDITIIIITTTTEQHYIIKI